MCAVDIHGEGVCDEPKVECLRRRLVYTLSLLFVTKLLFLLFSLVYSEVISTLASGQ